MRYHSITMQHDFDQRKLGAPRYVGHTDSVWCYRLRNSHRNHYIKEYGYRTKMHPLR